MKILRFVVIIFLSVIGISCSNKTYALKSPESVIKNFVSCIKNGQIDNAIGLSPFNVDNFVEKINPKEELLYMNAILPMDSLIFPISSIRKYELLYRYVFQIKYFVYSILLPEEFSGLIALNLVTINDEEKVNRFISALNVQNLKSIELVRFDIFNPENQFSERGRKYIDIQKEIYGLDEKVDYTVLYKNNGKYYAGTMTLVKYGNNWYILNLNSIYANWPSSGALETVSGVVDYLVKFDLKE